jgi:hypothetical protein
MQSYSPSNIDAQWVDKESVYFIHENYKTAMNPSPFLAAFF